MGIREFLRGVVRWEACAVAYLASLVDRYPTFTPETGGMSAAASGAGSIGPRRVLDNRWTVVRMRLDPEMDAEELAQRQYVRGLLNRRIAFHMERLDDVFSHITGAHGILTLLCACGREDCAQPLLTVAPEEYDRVRESPHRFIISPGHTTEIDEVVYVGDGFAIVQIRDQFRVDNPITADGDYPA